DFWLAIGKPAEAEALSFLENAGVGHGQRIVYVNPATRWATKFWSDRAWAELADKLIHELNVVVTFGGAPAELNYLDLIVSHMKQKPLVAAGRLRLMGAAALIKASSLYVGVDSGPMHIAALLGCPIVALFGPTDPAKVGPYGKGHVVVRKEELPCLGCRKSNCSDKRCLNGISAGQVFEEIRGLTGWN
ncbi:MAG: glycosyltransferase family 9 protein, partial [Desulfomonilaceae bacterium]